VEFLSAGFGEDFDAAVTEAIVFGGKWIAVDANLAYSGFGGELSAGEAVNVNLAAVSRSSSQIAENREFSRVRAG
jgi:hypothetical protein